MSLTRLISRRWPLHVAGIIAIGCATTLAQLYVGWFQTAEAWTRDIRNTLTPQVAEAPANVSVLYVTEGMLDELEYRVPVNRAYLAKLLEPLRDAGVAALGLDILFDHPTSEDQVLRQALTSMPFPVVYAWINESHGLRPGQVENLEKFIGTGYRGLATFLADSRDGVVRELPEPSGEQRVAPMASVLAKLTGKEEIELPRALAYPPVLGEGAPWVRAYPLNYLKQILARDPQAFNNKVVLVGLKSPLRDMHRISFVSFDAERGNLPGVVIHAHALAQILNNRELNLTPLPAAFLLALLLAGVGWFLGLQDLQLIYQVLLGSAALMAYGIVTTMVYASTSLFLPLILPSIALGLGLLISALAEGGQLRRQRSAVRKVFSQYVPKQVVDQLIDKPSQSLLAGHRATITCLFTDIAGFTTLAEKMDPVQLVELMNRYFDGVTRIIHKHEGTVDKFIGDAVLAFFGAPLEQPDHANRAVAAGIDIHQFSTDLRERLAKEGIDLGETRVGIHTGEAVVGNIGGELRQNYTALGDAVNLASRLEGANRYLGSRVCISETTMGMASDHPTRPLGNIVVKGRSETIGVYEPLAVVNQSEEFVKLYHEAYQALEATNESNHALELFQAMHEQAPNDRVIKMHIKHLESGLKSTKLTLESK